MRAGAWALLIEAAMVVCWQLQDELDATLGRRCKSRHLGKLQKPSPLSTRVLLKGPHILIISRANVL